MEKAEREHDYLTLIEAADYARCNERTLRRACWRGDLPHQRPFQKILIYRADLDAFLRRARGPAATR